MAKKKANKLGASAASTVAALRAAESSYLADLEICRSAIENSVLEQQAIGQAVKVFEERVYSALEER